MSETENSKKPLTGIRVVDLSSYLAAPSCGRFLAYMGADVIKVESLNGDGWRGVGNIYGFPSTETDNSLFLDANEGKKFIAVDMKTEEGLAIFHKLIMNADVFITNLMERSLKKLKITYDDLHSMNPKLVYGTITGYGDKGPEAGRPGFDATSFFSRGGYMLDFVPDGNPPNNFIIGAGDRNTTLSLAAGVLIALVGAQTSGNGVKVTTSLLQSSIWMASMNYVISQYGENYYIDRPYQCKDGSYMFAMAVTEKQKEYMCEILGVDKETYDDHIKIAPILKEKYASKSYEEWQEIFSHTNICCERLQHMVDIAYDEQAIDNNFILPYKGDSSDTVMIPMPPLKFKGSSESLGTDFRLGAHTSIVLKELGYSHAEIDKLTHDGIIKI